MKRILNNTIEREVYTVTEAAHIMHVSRPTFEKRFVATKRIEPIIYDADQGNELYFYIEDIRRLIANSRRTLNEDYLKKRFGTGYIKHKGV